MARPPDIDRRRELAQRAVEALEREGLGMSTERLAAVLGLKRPTLLYHFPTQAHLLEAALVGILSEQASVVLAAIEAHAHPIDRLFAQMRAIHAFHRGRESRIVFLTQAIATSGAERSAAIVARGTEVFLAHRRLAADRVREGILRGEVAPCDADALVASMRALTDGLLVQRVTDGLDLEAAHALIWQQLLLPLKRAVGGTSVKTTPRPTQKPAKATKRAKATGRAKTQRAARS